MHEFAHDLAPAWCPLFQLLVDTHSLPTQWKKAIIIPVPSKSCPRENSNFRLVALTSVVMKSFERIKLGELHTQVQHLLDPYQFACRDGEALLEKHC